MYKLKSICKFTTADGRLVIEVKSPITCHRDRNILLEKLGVVKIDGVKHKVNNFDLYATLSDIREGEHIGLMVESG